ncbi:TlpA family protein disulfide reductase [Corynebacterium aquatimens]|uniref:TlpA family protein disulfide reductase n=1 Tax=Corynebacterium aquatimens TaxID=1190508 RepID=UPI0025407AFD|nr:TlpA disulfide reductase family protein [Corynebacterium aquatimens]QYH20384.1 TlpA family protein disulfide reductase [Corynebacterium aquatimens]
MKKSVAGSVVAIVLVTVAVIAGAVVLLRGGGADVAQEASISNSPAPAEGDAVRQFIPGAEQRADCVAGGVGGIDLPCLGGKTVPGEHADVTVVNLWAWWCDPCRRELPIMQAFADAHPEISVVGVHADQNAANGVALMNELDVRFPSYQDDVNRFAGLLGLPGVVPILLVYKHGQPVGMFPHAFNSLEELENAVSGVL